MGYAGKLREKKMALRLRGRGLSYSEIGEKVKVSRGTLSLWCREVILTVGQMERLRGMKMTGSEKGRFVAAKRSQRKRLVETKKLFKAGIKDIGSLSERDRFVAGVSLYAGDGTKGDKAVQFANSNSEIIEFMMGWFRDFGGVVESKFRGSIWLHDNLSETKAKKFWSKVTDISMDHFHKTYVVKNKVESKKIRKNVNECGVFSIKIGDVSLQRRIKGWMSGVLGMKML